METQNKMLKAYLLNGGTITQPEATKLFGIGRLASRIYDLKEMGLNIESRFIFYTRKFDGKKTRIKNYYLKNNDEKNEK